MNRLPPASPARRHFMGIVAAGCGKTIDDRNFIGFARSPAGQKCRCTRHITPRRSQAWRSQLFRARNAYSDGPRRSAR